MRESLVALELLVYQRRILAESLLQVCDDGQRLVIDLHEFSSIARGVEIFGDYHGHRLSDVTHTALGQHRMTRDFQIRHLDGAGHRPKAGRIRAGVYGDHPGQSFGSIGANSLDLCVGVRRASEGAMDHARQLQVIGVMADPANHARVFFALHALADPGAITGFVVHLFARNRGFCRSGHGSPRSRPRRNGRGHFSRRVLHGGDNVLVTGAAAEIAVDALANLAI